MKRVAQSIRKESVSVVTEGGPQCAPFENKSEQIAQIVQALTPEARNTLLQALGQGEGGGQNRYLQPEKWRPME